MPSPRIPVEVVFNPNWWYCQYGISFDANFYLDRDARIAHDVTMRQVMFDRFGLGDPDPLPRPVIGSLYVAGGFVLPALFGVEVRFSPNEAPLPVAMNLSREAILALQPPDIPHSWPMQPLLADMDILQSRFGYLIGDFDTDGLFNTALLLRGQAFFTDLVDDPDLVTHLFTVLAQTYTEVAQILLQRTGTCAVSTNRSILNVDPRIYLHSNCSVQMISPATYTASLLPFERLLAERLQPYGIHHCGNNLHRFANAYSQVPAVFFDVGWGSDVARCRQALPRAFLNLRLSPVRMLQESAETIYQDTLALLSAAGFADRVGVCCINMDNGTPDENVQAMFSAVRAFEQQMEIEV